MTAAWVVEGKGVSLPVMQLASSPQSPVQSPKLGSLGSFLLMFPSLSAQLCLSSTQQAQEQQRKGVRGS